MSLLLINGGFRIIGAPPGGGQVRFHPDDPGAVSAAGLAPIVDSRGGVVLRLEGIDTLETRYVAHRGRWAWRQAGDLTAATAVSSARELGFSRAEFDDDGAVIRRDPEQARGHVLAWGVDGRSRLVGYAFRGRRRGRSRDLVPVEPDAEELRNSVNWVLLRQGLAYPVFTTRLAPPLRAELAAAAAHARDLDRGVWPRDVTAVGLRLGTAGQLRSGTVLYPTLFRRLVDYLEREARDPDEAVDLSALPGFLRLRGQELFTLPDGRTTDLAELVQVRRGVVRLTDPLDTLVFRER